MRIEESELRDRRVVWGALSELFLDTELDETRVEWIAGRLRESPYSVAQVEWILRREIGPVLGGSQWVWVKFDLQRLEDEVLRGRWRSWWGAWRWWGVKKDWWRVRDRLRVCGVCGYDLRGIGGRCPECGEGSLER